MKLDKEYAIRSISKALRHLIRPVEVTQATSIRFEEFRERFAAAPFTGAERSAYEELLGPAMKKSDSFRALLLQEVKLRTAEQGTNSKPADVIVVVTGPVKIVVIIIPPDKQPPAEPDPPQIEFCVWNSCFCANGENCVCVAGQAFKTGDHCPEDDCTDDASCGGGGEGGPAGGGRPEPLDKIMGGF